MDVLDKIESAFGKVIDLLTEWLYGFQGLLIGLFN